MLQHIVVFVPGQISGLVQDFNNCIANALELLLSCTKPSVLWLLMAWCLWVSCPSAATYIINGIMIWIKELYQRNFYCLLFWCIFCKRCLDDETGAVMLTVYKLNMQIKWKHNFLLREKNYPIKPIFYSQSRQVNNLLNCGTNWRLITSI